MSLIREGSSRFDKFRLLASPQKRPRNLGKIELQARSFLVSVRTFHDQSSSAEHPPENPRCS